MVNKKGQEMSVTTLVLIVVGVVLLVMLILGFSMGWKNLWGKINVLGGGSNVEAVIQACSISATSDSTYSYCNEFKKVTIGSETKYYNCQAPGVESALEKHLICKDDPIKTYCENLASGKTTVAQNKEVRETKVNDKTCAAYVAEITSPATTLPKCAENKPMPGVMRPIADCKAPTKTILPGPFLDVTDPVKGPICCSA
jgi:hypothetical protein